MIGKFIRELKSRKKGEQLRIKPHYVLYDKSTKTTRTVYSLDPDRLFFLSVFSGEDNRITKYSVDVEKAEDSHYEFDFAQGEDLFARLKKNGFAMSALKDEDNLRDQRLAFALKSFFSIKNERAFVGLLDKEKINHQPFHSDNYDCIIQSSSSSEEKTPEIPDKKNEADKMPFIKTRTYHSIVHKSKERGKRTLPGDCKWEGGLVIERWSLEEQREEGDARNTPKEGATIENVSGLINIRGSLVHYQKYIKVLPSKKTNITLNAYWHYKTGYVNPWIQNKILNQYLLSKGLPGCEGMYKEYKYKISLVGLPHNLWDAWGPRIDLCMHTEDTEDEEEFNKLAEIVEEYCISGYHPGEDVLQELLKKYTPVRVESETVFSGYHDENDDESIFYNDENEVIAKVVTRIYNKESGIWPLCEFLKENSGEAQVFGLNSAYEKPPSPPCGDGEHGER